MQMSLRLACYRARTQQLDPYTLSQDPTKSSDSSHKAIAPSDPSNAGKLTSLEQPPARGPGDTTEAADAGPAYDVMDADFQELSAWVALVMLSARALGVAEAQQPGARPAGNPDSERCVHGCYGIYKRYTIWC